MHYREAPRFAGWRLVAQTDDFDEAVGVVEQLNRRCFSEPPSVA
jgi:hypothetical protein